MGSVPATSLTTDPSGVVAQIELNEGGNTVFDAVSPEATIVQAAPEPGAMWLAGAGMLALAVASWCGRR